MKSIFILLATLIIIPVMANGMTYNEYTNQKREILKSIDLRDQHYLETHKLTDAERDAHWACLNRAHIKEADNLYRSLDEYINDLERCFK